MSSRDAKKAVSATYPIGEIARRADTKVATVRYYESIGLLAAPPRSDGGRRVYDDDAIARLKLIRHARELGFEIEQIRRLLELAGQPQRSCAEVDAIAREHLADIDSRMTRLAALRDELQHMVAHCEQGRVCECRILEVLGNHGYCRHPEH